MSLPSDPVEIVIPAPCTFPRCIHGVRPPHCGHDCDKRAQPYEHEYGVDTKGHHFYDHVRKPWQRVAIFILVALNPFFPFEHYLWLKVWPFRILSAHMGLS